MPVYNKLVRDRIEEIIINEGKTPITRVLSEQEFILEVQKKMHEELKEYEEATHKDSQLEELADLLELIHSACSIHGASPAELEKLRAQKAKQRGGFAKGIYLVEVQDD